MARSIKYRSDFTEAFAVHAALRQAMKQKLFQKDARLAKVAERMIRALESEQSSFGRQLKMLQLMRHGATIDDMEHKLKCSRRTVFRYLNHLEEAGLQVSLTGNLYRASGPLLKALTR